MNDYMKFKQKKLQKKIKIFDKVLNEIDNNNKMSWNDSIFGFFDSITFISM